MWIFAKCTLISEAFFVNKTNSWPLHAKRRYFRHTLKLIIYNHCHKYTCRFHLHKLSEVLFFWLGYKYNLHSKLEKLCFGNNFFRWYSGKCEKDPRMFTIYHLVICSAWKVFIIEVFFECATPYCLERQKKNKSRLQSRYISLFVCLNRFLENLDV